MLGLSALMCWLPAVRASTIEVNPRSAWQARAPTGPCKPHTISSISIHHTATESHDNTHSLKRLRSYQRYHQDSKGWVDLAYHLFVDLDGNVYAGRNHECVGDTSTNYDPTGHFLIVLEGNFEVQQVSDRAYDSLVDVVTWAIDEFDVKIENIQAHRQLAATACPGKNLFRKIQDDLVNQLAQRQSNERIPSSDLLNGKNIKNRDARQKK